MERQNPGNAPPPDSKTQPPSAKVPDDIARKQQAFRRHLQDPAGPAYHDPMRAAELAGLGPRPPHLVAAGHTTLFGKLGVRQQINNAIAEKSATICRLRRRMTEGMNATKFVTVRDAEGIRSVEVPDQIARRAWAQLCAQVENLLPSKNSDGSETLARDLEDAEELERFMANDVSCKLSKLSVASKYQLSEFAVKIEQLRQSTASRIAEQILGKSIQEFEQHVQEQADREVSEAMQEVFHRGDDANGKGGEDSHE